MSTRTPATVRSPSRNRALVIGFAVLCGLAPAALALSPRSGEPVAVLTLFPDAVLPRAVTRTDARILWMSANGRVVVLHSSQPNLVSVLYRDGATLVLAASFLSGCMPSTSRTSSLSGVPHL